jgi:hypothetical protein
MLSIVTGAETGSMIGEGATLAADELAGTVIGIFACIAKLAVSFPEPVPAWQGLESFASTKRLWNRSSSRFRIRAVDVLHTDFFHVVLMAGSSI